MWLTYITDADRARCVDGMQLGFGICRQVDDDRILSLLVQLELLLARAANHVRVGQGIVADVWPSVQRASA